MQLVVIRSPPPLAFSDTPVTAMLMGRGFLAEVAERRDTVDVMVDEDMALVGRDDPVPPGVTSPDRRTGGGVNGWRLDCHPEMGIEAR